MHWIALCISSACSHNTACILVVVIKTMTMMIAMMSMLLIMPIVVVTMMFGVMTKHPSSKVEWGLVFIIRKRAQSTS